MGRRLYGLALGLISLLFFAQPALANSIEVIETASRIKIANNTAEVLLAVSNSTSTEYLAHVKIELLDPQNNLSASALCDAHIKRGRSSLELSLPLSFLNQRQDTTSQILWHRLRYRIATAWEIKAQGILSVSTIMPDLFELRVSVPRYAREGIRYRAVVRALHPASRQPRAGVAIDAEVAFDDTPDLLLRASAVTGPEGYAAFHFDLPASIKTGGGEIRVSGRLGNITHKASEDIRFMPRSQIFISTDKPLYQPGQTLRMRALAFDSSKRALSDQTATLKVIDPDGKTLYRADMKTSRFGVASADWAIPENARLGD
jgi:hypothetical protein